MSALRAAAVALSLSLAPACSHTTTPQGDGPKTTVRVTLNAQGDAKGMRAMSLARRYAPHGTFQLTQSSQTTASTDGGRSTSTATSTLVFVLHGNADTVVQRLRAEPFVISVSSAKS